MKKLLIKTIKTYQRIPGPWRGYCKHTPSCSNYAVEAIDTLGVMRGLYYSFIRVLKCNPFGKGGYDPVPKRKVKYEKK